MLATGLTVCYLYINLHIMFKPCPPFYAWCADLLFGQLNWNTVFADTHQRWEAQKQAWAERRKLLEMQQQSSIYYPRYIHFIYFQKPLRR